MAHPLPHRRPQKDRPQHTRIPTGPAEDRSMPTITTTQIRELRRRTGGGMIACKEMLITTGGDVDQAVELLRQQGITKAAEKLGRPTKEGVIGRLLHHNGRPG